MPERAVRERARRDRREGKAPTTQAGEFVREEIEHVREGKHGARSAKQAIAIGLSKARRAGVKLPVPRKGSASSKTRSNARKALEAGRRPTRSVSAKRSRAVTGALKREDKSSVSGKSLARQAKASAASRTASSRSASSRRASRTKGPATRTRAARKAARTRASHRTSR